MPASKGGSRASIAGLSLPSFAVAGIWVSIAVLVGGALAPPLGGLEREMQLVLAVFLFALVLWLTEAVPYVVSSTAASVLLFALDLVPTFGDAVSGFASTLVFFLLLLLLLGGAISEVGLGKVVAGRMLSTRSTPRTSVRSLAAHMFGLSLLMPSAVARTVTFIPVVNRMTDAYGLPDDGTFRKACFIVLGHINPIGSMMLMTGGGMAIITSQLINESVRTVTWVQWAVYMIPPMILLFWLSTVSALVVYGVDDDLTLESNGSDGDAGNGEHAERDGDDALNATGGDDALDANGIGDRSGGGVTLTRDQRIVSVVMLGAVVAWIAGSFVGLPTIVPAAAAVAVLSVPGVGIVDRDLIADVSWGILFLIGAMFSILDAMETTGTLDYVVETLIEVVPFAAMAPWLVIGTLLALAVFIRSWFSTASAAIVVALPIIMEFATVLGLNRLYLALSVLIAVGSTTFFPFNTTSVLLSYDKGPLGLREVLVFGLVTMVHGVVVIALSWLFYWPLVV
ncbi:sodium:sulfate symporter [Halorubrum salipaludis]|uniref:Sodium:sulfate symporter n=1 Tax=Halorubrum salipaludis TaxID=2032630 RepID=A0A2A2FJJ4_9EURY|nr:SLC13 family permease [Halorubrum salipaludis]PAU85098.1 sodium:sulfate symporter [Halorubrum salipaludis]